MSEKYIDIYKDEKILKKISEFIYKSERERERERERKKKIEREIDRERGGGRTGESGVDEPTEPKKKKRNIGTINKEA